VKENLRNVLGTMGWAMLVVFLSTAAAYASQPHHLDLTWQHDPRTTVTVTWRTNESEPSLVQYGLDASYGLLASSGPGVIHHVELSGLKPSTTYHFRCGSEEGWSGDETFTTAPGNPSEPFTFVVLGDSRTDMYSWAGIARAALKTNPAFVVATGDLVESGRFQGQWDRWFEAAEPLLSRTVFMPLLGNHEENSPLYFEQFALPSARQWYSFDYGNAHFVILNTEGFLYGEQLEWLEEDLARSNATWRFVYFHRPMYSVGSHGCSLYVQRAWEGVLERYHVDMVFCGHDHIYSRTLPIYAGEAASSSDLGTIHIVTGGAGAPLHSIQASGSPWLAAAASEHHFLVISIDGSTLRLEARLRDQRVLDTLVLNKTLRPDLTVSELTLFPSMPRPHENATLSGVVWNRGQARSGNFSIQIMADGKMVGLIAAGPLAPGERAHFGVPWEGSDEGYHNLTALVDALNLVNEGILEWNNAKSLIALVSSPGPDLVPTSLRLVSGELSAGKNASFAAVIENRGSLPSPAFNVGFYAMGLNGTLSCPALEAGRNATVTFPPIRCTAGDWAVWAVADPEDAVEELDEGNNWLNVTIPVRDLIKLGPVYYPRGAAEGEDVLIKYDDVEGLLPDRSDECALAWGTNGWRTPRLRPAGTLSVAGWVESKMERGLDGLWTIMIPTDQSVNRIDFRFRNGQVVGDTFDDNGGSSWSLPMRGYATRVVKELGDAMRDAALAGVNVSSYESVLQEANRSFLLGDYPRAAEVAGDLTLELRRLEALTIYDRVAKAYGEALEENLTIPRGELMLRVAKESIENENFDLAKNFMESLSGAIEKARASVPQRGFIAAFLVIGAMTLLFRPRKICRSPRTTHRE